jgi:hypothetical protein
MGLVSDVYIHEPLIVYHLQDSYADKDGQTVGDVQETKVVRRQVSIGERCWTAARHAAPRSTLTHHTSRDRTTPVDWHQSDSIQLRRPCSTEEIQLLHRAARTHHQTAMPTLVMVRQIHSGSCANNIQQFEWPALNESTNCWRFLVSVEPSRRLNLYWLSTHNC